MTSRTGLIAVLALLLACACRKHEVANVSPDAGGGPLSKDVAATPSKDGDPLFVVASPRSRIMALPARFSAALPTSEADLEAPQRFPPVPMITAALNAGDPAMRQKLLDAVRAAATDGAVPEALADFYVRLFGYAPAPSSCDWLQTAAMGKEPPNARAIFFRALVRCPKPDVAKAFARDDAPDQAVIDWYFERGDAEALPFNPRVPKAALAVAAAGNKYEVRKIGFAFARMTGAASIKALEGLQRKVEDPELRALVALGMLRHPSPEGTAFGREACKVLSEDPMCSAGGAASSQGERRAGRIEEALEREPWPDVRARFPKDALATALSKCARDGERDYERASCLSRLASLDRPKAVTVARELRLRRARPGEPAPLADVVRALTSFPAAGALEQRLAELGFTAAPAAGAASVDEAGVDVEGTLSSLGRVSRFDVETGTFPNVHDELLADLARLAAPELDGVVFEEVPPPESRMDDGPYLLRAYADGKRYEVKAENLGDWYDLDAVLGLLNALLTARGSEWRFTTLPTGDQTATVLAGPKAGILALAKERLISVGTPGDSAQAGKEFEERVFEQLKNQGGVIRPSGENSPDFLTE